MKFKLFLAFISQAYISVIGIILIPVYLHYLGAEAFGLVGFYMVVQAWVSLLDMGFTPVMSRDMSRYRVGVITKDEIAIRLRSIEIVQGGIAFLVVVAFGAGSDWIGANWLSVTDLKEDVVSSSVAMIGFSVVFRWIAGLYRGVLVGYEMQGVAISMNVIFTTLRYVGVLLLLIYVSVSPRDFFLYQMIIGVLELIGLAISAYYLVSLNLNAKFNWKLMKEMVPMLGGMTFLSSAWVVLTQIDKLILSGVLLLEDYGNFMLAVMVANGILLFIPPLHQIIQPRLTILSESESESKLIELYRLVSQFAVVGFICLGCVLAFFAAPILLYWTGDKAISEAAAPVLFWYGLANSVIGILVLPFMLQFAKGKLRLHILGNIILLTILVPALILSAIYLGGIGAGQVFFTANFLFLILWVPFVHKQFAPSIKWTWLFRDVILPGGAVIVCFAVAKYMLPDDIELSKELFWAVITILSALSVGVFLGGFSRNFIFGLLGRREI